MTSAIRLRLLVAEERAAIRPYDQEEFARKLHYDRPIASSLLAFQAARSSTGRSARPHERRRLGERRHASRASTLRRRAMARDLRRPRAQSRRSDHSARGAVRRQMNPSFTCSISIIASAVARHVGVLRSDRARVVVAGLALGDRPEGARRVRGRMGADRVQGRNARAGSAARSTARSWSTSPSGNSSSPKRSGCRPTATPSARWRSR